MAYWVIFHLFDTERGLRIFGQNLEIPAIVNWVRGCYFNVCAWKWCVEVIIRPSLCKFVSYGSMGYQVYKGGIQN